MANEVGKIEYTISVNKDGLVTGIKQANNSIGELGKEAENSSSKVGNLAGAVGKIGAAAAITGITAVTTAVIGVGKASIEAYANYEQLVGGVETLFKDSSDTIQEYAKNAYKTAGLSVNEYLEQATSFSATLIRDTGGDTAKVAELINTAITDMSDNANKMGSDIRLIQNAYEGLSKGNATMLDNLKVGYGGTQKEMLKLAKDMGVVAESVESFNDISFEDAILAIHEVQNQLGFTGTTAKEAETTISGSIGMMSSAWDNLVLSMSSGEGVEEAFQAWSDAFLQVITNLDPIINTLAENLPIVAEKLGEFLPKIIEPLTPVIQTVVKALVEVVTGMIDQLVPIITPAVLKLAFAVFQSLLEAWINWQIEAYTWVGEFIAGLWDKFKNFVGNTTLMFAQMALDIFGKVNEMWTKIKNVFTNIGVSISEAITGAVKGAVNSVMGFAENTVNGFIRAINTAIGVINAIPGVSISTLAELSIPRLATGGIVEAGNGGQIIRAGEAGEDEWVVPESKMASLVEQINDANNGNNITINVSGTFATSETEQRRVAEQIYEALQDINRSRMGAYL